MKSGQVDSVWQVNNEGLVTDKAFPLGDGLLRVLAYGPDKAVTDEFIFNYKEKLAEKTRGRPAPGKGNGDLAWLLRQYQVYDAYDRNHYAVSSVWLLSVGIDDYGPGQQYATCKTDAESYASFFREQFTRNKPAAIYNSLFHAFVLRDSQATRDAILAVLREIAGKAARNDYFIFNFSGCSNLLKDDPQQGGTHFFPWDVIVEKQTRDWAGIKNRNPGDKTPVVKNCISLRELQEHIQLIPADNQLFISEAGPSKDFKTEFIKSLMQRSSEVAGILNKNRIIVVPNGFGYDMVNCGGKMIDKGPINYYFTSLDSTADVYDLFRDERRAEQLASLIENKAFSCRSFSFNYFDIFFEKKFLQQYREIFADENGPMRGLQKEKSKELEETVGNLVGKRYALVIGTDHYSGDGWNDLSNPIKDARAVADELRNSYGFEIQLLEDKPMDSIYRAILDYHRVAKPNDQLVVYFAGHGDVDEELLDDGFIVCTDSRSVEEDPVRNSYIPYGKLKKMLNNIPARQVLVLLDVCHGGTFDEKAFAGVKRDDGISQITNRNVLQFLKEKLPLRTRKFLSSVGSEPAFDGQAGRHSPFANLLLQVLRAKGSGSNGIVTLSDINAVLKTASLNETATLRISPHMDDFGDVDAFSEFVLIPVEKK